MKRVSAFHEFLSTLSQVEAGPKTAITLCTGGDEFLLGLCRETYRNAWKSNPNQTCVAIEQDQLLKDSFVDTFGQNSMFDPAMFFIVYLPACTAKVIEKIKKLAQTGSSNRLLILMRGKPTAPLLKEVKANIAITHLPCPEPAPYEIVDFIEFQAKQTGLVLDRPAAKLVADCLGRDLTLIANELRRIALFFGEEHVRLSVRQIAPHLGLLKEEMVFRLRNYILERKLGGADALLSHLLDRGESGLAILGFLAKHCRAALIVLESIKNGDNQNDIAKKSNLQKYLVSGYTKYVQKIGPIKLNEAMQQCIVADRKFKSERMSHHLLLSEIIQTLC